MQSYLSNNIPVDYLCPIRHELMTDPVVASDGHTYERESITEWIRRGNRKSPLSGINLPNTYIFDNILVKKIINEFKQNKNKEISFLTGLSIVGVDDVGVVNNITSIISGELKINIAAITIESKDGVFEGTIKVYVHDKDELELLVEKIKSVSGIQQVNRFDTETV
jgi:predicted amino acid-binding ACT domain protein